MTDSVPGLPVSRVPTRERVEQLGTPHVDRPLRRVGESMTLLTEVMDHPLDPSYVLAAEHRGRHHRSSWRERVLLLSMAVVAGIAVVAAVASLRAPQPAVAQARSLLAEEIQTKRTSIAALNQANSDLRDEVAQLRSDVLKGSDPALQEQTDIDAMVSAAAAVSGPGLVVTLHDGPLADQDDAAQVQDLDLQRVVNELWVSGAEAIAVNGNRLGPTSAIRGAGGAVLVNLVALTPPYRVEAIGATNTMQVEFARSSVADDLAALKDSYGIAWEVSGASALTLPAAPTSVLVSATLTGDSPVASGGTGTSTGEPSSAVPFSQKEGS